MFLQHARIGSAVATATCVRYRSPNLPSRMALLQVLAKVANMKLAAAWGSWLDFIDARMERKQRLQKAASFWLNGTLAAAFSW
jgi:hypothetical protein